MRPSILATLRRMAGHANLHHPTTSLRTLIARGLNSAQTRLYKTLGVRIEIHARRPKWQDQGGRYSYQKQFIDFDIKEGDRVLDVGSGADPFPHATVLMDRFVEMSATRRRPLVTQNKPLVVADIHELPFRDKSFDYVYSAHVLEVTEDPLKACRELIRVGKRGFIETPNAAKDMLFAWAKGLQKWHVVAIGHTLCFFEYSNRELEGIGSTLWRDRIFSERHDPIQEMFYPNQDAFNVMFTWEDRFSVFVFLLDGTIHSLDGESSARLPSLPR
jgi:SAM-dependent methyltransferase